MATDVKRTNIQFPFRPTSSETDATVRQATTTPRPASPKGVDTVVTEAQGEAATQRLLSDGAIGGTPMVMPARIQSPRVQFSDRAQLAVDKGFTWSGEMKDYFMTVTTRRSTHQLSGRTIGHELTDKQALALVAKLPRSAVKAMLDEAYWGRFNRGASDAEREEQVDAVLREMDKSYVATMREDLHQAAIKMFRESAGAFDKLVHDVETNGHASLDAQQLALVTKLVRGGQERAQPLSADELRDASKRMRKEADELSGAALWQHVGGETAVMKDAFMAARGIDADSYLAGCVNAALGQAQQDSNMYKTVAIFSLVAAGAVAAGIVAAGAVESGALTASSVLADGELAEVVAVIRAMSASYTMENAAIAGGMAGAGASAFATAKIR